MCSSDLKVPVVGNYEPLSAAQVTDIATKAKQLSQEIRIGRLEGEGFRWAVGALYWKEDYSSVNASLFISGFSRNAPIPAATFPAGWSAAAGAAAVSTVFAMGLFFAGVTVVGPGQAAVLSTVEPVVSIAVGVLLLDESLGATRLAGAVLVLTGVKIGRAHV